MRLFDYTIKCKNRPMDILGCNEFNKDEADDAVPYIYLKRNQVSHLILIDGNEKVLYTERPLIPSNIRITYVEGVVQPLRL